MFQINFGTDGSIYINFPYFKHSQGIASKVLMPKGQSYYKSLSITDNAKVTSHLIKYSHHSSGEALFSKTNKVQTVIRKHSVPLKELGGHFFTISLQGLDGFEVGNEKKYDHHWSPKKSVVQFNYEEEKPEALRFVGVWQPYAEFGKDLVLPIGQSSYGPQFKYADAGGFVLSPDKSNPLYGHILVLRVHVIAKLNPDAETILSFIGGFDKKDTILDTSNDSSFLSLLYPAKNPDVMKKNLGSMDLEELK